MKKPNRLSLIAASLAVVLTATACGTNAYEATSVPVKSPEPVKSPAPPAKQDCTNALQSYAPDGPLPTPGAMPAGSTMADILKNDRLIAGISADSLNLGSRNPITGQIEGFDIDMIKAVAKAIFGDENKVELRVISSPQRIPVLQVPRTTPNVVDIVARNMTINCSRWKDIAFSAEYYRSGQKLLVRSDMKAESLKELSGQKVCAPTGSTSYDNMVRENPKVIPVTADTDTGCLVLFQQGKVVAITGDDTVLAGEAAQDPYARITKAPKISEEPYGLGINKGQKDFVQFVNGVLEQMKADGRWQASYKRWLEPSLQVPATPPAPIYGR